MGDTNGAHRSDAPELPAVTAETTLIQDPAQMAGFDFAPWSIADPEFSYTPQLYSQGGMLDFLPDLYSVIGPAAMSVDASTGLGDCNSAP